MRNALKDHKLVKVQDGEVLAFYLRKEDTLSMSTLLVFTPEGIAMMGDLTPERNGSISSRSYGLKWFVGELSESYLCEKFLEQKYVPELAKQALLNPNGYLREDADEETISKLDNLANIIDSLSTHELYEHLTDMGYASECIPGYGYDPGEAGWLCAIQQKFAALYHGRC